MVNLTNHITGHTAYTAIAATVGYGLTRAFTVLNPIAGATFFGTTVLAGAFTDPIFNRDKSNKTSITLGKMIQVALAWIATPHLTPIVTTALKAISTEVLSTGALVAGSISITPQVAGITALALVIILGYQFGGKAIKSCKRLGKNLMARLPSLSSPFSKMNKDIRGSLRETGNFEDKFDHSDYSDSENDRDVKRGQQEQNGRTKIIWKKTENGYPIEI